MWGFQMLMVLKLFLMVPVAEQGASTRTLSKAYPRYFLPSLMTVMVFCTPHFCRFMTRDFILSGLMSFARMTPLLFIMSAICVVFDPGDAAMSNTVSPALGARIMGGIMLDASCT